MRECRDCLRTTQVNNQGFCKGCVDRVQAVLDTSDALGNLENTMDKLEKTVAN